MSLNESSVSQQLPDEQLRRARRRFVPHFGLRTLFIVAVLFCFLFAGLGKNAYRMRQAEAALEALKRADARIRVHGDDDPDWRTADEFTGYPDSLGRLIGWKKPISVSDVLSLACENPDDPAFANALGALPVFDEIEHVSLQGRGVMDRSLITLRRLPKLESIDLTDTEVTKAGLAQLGPPLSIQEATFYDVPSAGLATGLESLKELRVLSFNDASLDGSDLATIASLTKLEALQFRGVQFVKDGDYGPLANSQRLTALYLYDADVSDDDMATVAKLDRLEELLVHGITDAGLKRLAPLPNLHRLEVASPVTEAAAIQYSVEHPGCLVRYENVGYLVTYRTGAPVDEETLPLRDRWPWYFPSNE